MFVVFEGIDGSGKTTISNRVAGLLRKRGHDVFHVREKGAFASALVSRMRTFAKDPQNLMMSPDVELLLYAGRELQLLAECIEPQLAAGKVVFADRFLYSAIALAQFARGLAGERVSSLVSHLARGRWPDVVYLIDVDPFVARARRKVRKIEEAASGAAPGLGSRKGLGGAGMQHRMRDGYRDLAAAEPDRWVVIENSQPSVDLEHLSLAIADDIICRVGGTGRHGNGSSKAGLPSHDAGESMAASYDAVSEVFFARLRARCKQEPGVAAYFLSGLHNAASYELREQLIDRVPDVVAHSLTGLVDATAWQLRDRLKERAPRHVLRSLVGRETASDRRAYDLRTTLVDEYMRDVLASLVGLDDSDAWRHRDAAGDDNLANVVASLRAIDSDRAWRYRDRLWARGTASREHARAVAQSLWRLGGDRAWRLRDGLLEVAPVAVLRSTAGLTDSRAWRLRDRLVAFAPKAAMASLGGVDDERAWTLRTSCVAMVKEALDSIAGLDCEPAWQLREHNLKLWPSTAVKSLGRLFPTDRGQALARAALMHAPQNISLQKHIVRLRDITAFSNNTERVESS